MSYIRRLTDSSVALSIHAKPGAKISQLIGISENVLDVQISARAVDGAANAELIDFMASVLKIKKRQISIIAGEKSRDKTLQIMNLEISEIVKALESEIAT